MAFERILVAHDLTDASDEAMRMAVELAKEHGASLTILHVYPIPVIPMYEGYVVQSPATVVEIQRAVEAGLKRVEEQVRALGLQSVATEARTGGAAEEILRFARAGGFDLIVMGTHGRKGIRRMILGSVAEAVVRRSPSPVLTVHPAPEEAPLEEPARQP